MVFLKIGNHDLTPYTDIQNFEVNQADEYTTWVDGNHVEHREVMRTRIEGKVKVGFRFAEELDDFYSALAANVQQGGYYPVTAYVQNTAQTVTFNAFIETTAKSKFDLPGYRFWKEVELTIKER